MIDSEVVRTGPIRYANAERFEGPRLVLDAQQRPSSGEICPQLPSRLEQVMGAPRDTPPQGEDCLNLTITAPPTDGTAHPVMVWFHGGGFTSGAGVLDWYDGSRLTAEGGVVVVSVNYRLGAFGYLYRPGVSDGNLGLYDQLEALRWVNANIAAYGGDAGNVTVVGQSAGGLSIRVLMDMPQARGLFQRAILQSAPLAYATRTKESALAVGELFAHQLAEEPRTADTATILRAQRATAVAHRKLSASAMEPLFAPVAGVRPLCEALLTENARGLDVMYGWNADDMSAFTDEGTDSRRLTDEMYTQPLRAFGEQLVAAGGRVSAYRLDWRPAGSVFGATHCLELPLLFGSRAAWSDSPMLGTLTWEAVESFGSALRAAWIGFARCGTPDRDATVGWPVSWARSGTLAL